MECNTAGPPRKSWLTGWILLFSSLCLVCGLLLTSQAVFARDDALGFSQADGRVMAELVKYLSTDHYSRQAMDDRISEQFVAALLDRLDPDRLFFLASDVKAFEAQYQDRMDDLSAQGNLEPARELFLLYRDRVGSRLRKEIAGLPARVAGFDFTVDEQYQTDRASLPWAQDEAGLDEAWRKSIKAMAVDLVIAGKDRAAIAELLAKRLDSQLQRLDRLNHTDFLEIYTNTLTELYDPHTNYLSPAKSEQFAISMRLSLEGIGATLQADNQYTRVMSLVPGGPAEKQGQLQPADRIVGVAQGDDPIQDVIGWRLDDVVALIRGPKGSAVRLEVIPASAPSESERRTIRIIRDQVKLEDQAASGHRIEVGEQHRPLTVIELPTFYTDYEGRAKGDDNYRSTTRDVLSFIRKFDTPDSAGLILDLRNNGGGDLHEAIDLTGLFIHYGPVVQIRTNRDYVAREGKSGTLFSRAAYQKPVVVLVNRLSASASEIVAAALQDYDRAIIVGSRTFGKGTVQTLGDLDEGQLKLTVSKFYRISGGSTQHKGVEPDITLPSVYDEQEIGESSYKTALPWDSIHGIRHMDYYPVQALLPDIEKMHEQRVAKDPDFNFITESLRLTASHNKDTVDLNLDKRKAQLDAWRTMTLDLENARRKAKGLPAYDRSVFEKLDDNGQVDIPDDKPTQPAKTDPEAMLYSDMYLMEAAHVLLDFHDALDKHGISTDLLAVDPPIVSN